MTRAEFAKKALDGAFNPLGKKILGSQVDSNGDLLIKYDLWSDPLRIPFDVLVFEPHAWEAVGVAMEWAEMPHMMVLEIQDKVIQRARDEDFRRILTRETLHRPWWRHNMHKMIDALCDGKTVDDFLTTL